MSAMFGHIDDAALAVLPPSFRKLAAERADLNEALDPLEAEARRLADPRLDSEAENADDAALANATRKGQPWPARNAAADLAKARAVAAKKIEANRIAFAAVEADMKAAFGKLHADENRPSLARLRTAQAVYADLLRKLEPARLELTAAVKFEKFLVTAAHAYPAKPAVHYDNSDDATDRATVLAEFRPRVEHLAAEAVDAGHLPVEVLA